MNMNTDWVSFYKEFSTKLLNYKNDRQTLLKKIKIAYDSMEKKFPFIEDDGDEYDDVCPFTVMATFNKQLSEENRIAIIKAYKKEFQIESETPTAFDSIPRVNNLSAWFFTGRNERKENDIDNLWTLFEVAIDYADLPTENKKQKFIKAYDKVIKQKQVKWNITFGLYWIRPDDYLNLDSQNRKILFKRDLPYSDLVDKYLRPKNPPSGENYIKLVESLKSFFDNSDNPHKNFRELSYSAYIAPPEFSEPESINPESESRKYWIYSPGRHSKYWDEFYKKGIMAIGWNEIGDIRKYNNKTEIADAFREVHDDNRSHKNDALALWQFAHEIQVGDVIFVKKGKFKIIGRGEVASDYYYDATLSDYNNIRDVKWTHKGEWDHPGEAVTKTLTDLTPYLEYISKLEGLFEEDEVDDYEPETFDAYTEDEFLNEVFMTPEKYNTIVSLLKRKKNIILEGPPGVGKTFAAKRLAYSLMNEADYTRVKMIQFHQNYSYEDFIMGYRPTEHSFELQHGPFYKFCKKAEEDDERDYFFIIDEINRGNLSKILGELMMLIESDKRGERIKLMYKDELFSVPKNVHLIGLMNTADRSLAMIDYALRRRFAFIDLEPAFDSKGFRQLMEKVDNPTFYTLIREIKHLNEAIKEDENLGEGFTIGHSYFTLFDNVTDERLKSIVKHEIIPLIREYWFDDQDKINLWKTRLLEVFNG